MRPIRIVLSGLPRMLRDIVVQVVESEADMSIVGEVSAAGSVQDLVDQARPDVVVFDDASLSAAGGTEHLLRGHRDVKVLLLSDQGRDATAHWLEPRTTSVADLSPERLLTLIRTCCGGPVAS